MTKLYFKTLSPLHIGTGKVLEPFDYIFHQEKVIILNQEMCLERMFDTHLESVDRYTEWIQQTVQRMNNAKKEAREAKRNQDGRRARQHNQILAEIRKNFNLVYFCESVLGDRELAREFLQNNRYHKNAMYALDRPGGTRQLREMLHINGRPYVPGSSLKGAIRTALAYRAVKKFSGEAVDMLLNGKNTTNIQGIGAPLQQIRQLSERTITAIEKGSFPEIERAFRELHRERNRWLRRIGDEVEKVVFGCGDGGTRLGEKFDDPKFDLLRLIKISDSLDGQWELLAGHLMSFTRNNRTGQLNAQPIQYCQFIDENSYFAVDLEVDTQLIAAILNNRVKGWTGFEEKFRTLFEVDPHLPAEELEQAVVESILQAVREFGQAIVEKEKAWLQQFGNRQIRPLQEFYGKLPQDAALLRVGFSSGWHSTTVGLALAENPHLAEYLPEIIYVFNLDLIQNQKNLLKNSAEKIVENRLKKIKKNNLSKEEKEKQINKILNIQVNLLNRNTNVRMFPRSRRLIAQNRQPYAPVGWVQMDLKAFNFKNKSQNKNSMQTLSSETSHDDFQEKLRQLQEKFRG